jgi:tetratricopeptide (TPR) repeat protein
MKRWFIIGAIVLVSAGCSRKIIRPGTEGIQGGRADNRYDYILTEALRQKYVGDVNEAAELFEKCIEIDKSRAVPWFELAQMYSAAGMGGKALLYASTAARLDEGNYWYQLACGSLFTQYQMKDSAIVYFGRAIKADKRAYEVNGILAGLYAEKGDTQKADSLFLELEKEGALSPEMSQMMIFSLINSANYREAAERTKRLIGQFPDETRYKALLADIYYEDGHGEESDSIYNEIIRNDPDNVETQMLYLVSLLQRKEYSGIFRFLDNVFRSDVVERERKIAVAQRLAGDSLFIKDNADAFIGSLETLEAQYPDDEQIMSLRPGIYELTGNKEKAIGRYEEIISNGKPGFWFKEKLLNLYADEKDYEKMFNLASGYSKDNNRSILGKFYYALSAMELKHYDIAGAELKKALILAGNNDEMKVQVLSMMGDLKYRMKDYDGSYALYEEALKISPEEPLLLNNYAYFLAEGGHDLKKALKMAEKVMTIEGDNPTYIDTYAWVLYKIGKNREAYREMRRIFENGGEHDAELLEHMGYILNSLGDCRQAIAFWREALGRDKSKSYLEKEISKCEESIK